MKHLFVPYEIAKQLKEKGFNEPCCAKSYELDKDKDEKMIHYGSVNFPQLWNSSVVNDTRPLISIPMYQQVVDWLRDKHKLYITIYRVRSYINESHCWCLDYINNEAKITKSYPIDKSMVGVKEKDYYTALTKAIEEALKLIY